MNNINNGTLWIILFGITCVLIIYIRSQLSAPSLEAFIEKNNISLLNIQDLLDNANNGDLIFMCGDTHFERSCRWITGSVYSHVGLLFREKDPLTNDDILYIFDADMGQSYREGPRVMKLYDKLKRYHGYPYIMWRKLECNDEIGECNIPSTQQILDIVKHVKDYDFDNNMLTWFVSNNNFICRTLYSLVKNHNKIFCSELIAYTLQQLNILNNDKKPSWYSPATFSKNIIEGLQTNYKYSKPIYYKNTL